MNEQNDAGKNGEPWYKSIWPFAGKPKDDNQTDASRTPRPPKRQGLNVFNDLNDNPPSATPREAAPASLPKPKEEPPKPAPSSSPGEYELGLGALGKRIDSLTSESRNLIEGLKSANKSREDAHELLKKTVKDLQGQNEAKDELIKKMQRQSEMREAFPALKAMAKLRKTVAELQASSLKQSKEEILQWIVDSIDGSFADLDVSMIEHGEGKLIDAIPGDQMETLRFEETSDASKANTIAKALTPCYLLKNDSKIIVIAKAQLIVFKLINPPQIQEPSCPSQETSSVSTSAPPPPSSPDSTRPESPR